MHKNIKFSDAINRAIFDSMKKNKKLFCFGLGINDPKRIFGTTNNLVEEFGSKRVFDTPTSENGITGFSIGAALKGFPSIASHQRVDFFLLAMDQIVNSAAKWYYMFGSKTPIPITIRLIVGKGWGQGPTHSQHLHSWFCHIPGLKVVCPTNSHDAYHLLKQSIEDKNPTIFFEHRWLHNSTSIVNFNDRNKILGKSKVIKKGSEITIVASSNMVIESLKALEVLKKNKFKISIELIDVRTYKPLDIETILKSVKKTGRILVVDPGFSYCSFGSEIISQVSTKIFKYLKQPPAKLAAHDIPEPTSYFYTKKFDLNHKSILIKIFQILKNKNFKNLKFENEKDHDVPGDWFKGPF